MGIYLPNMEMPKNCKNCMDVKLNVAVSVFGAMCPFCEKIFLADIDINKQRLDDCPLIELPFAEELAEKLYKQIEKAVIEGSET